MKKTISLLGLLSTVLCCILFVGCSGDSASSVTDDVKDMINEEDQSEQNEEKTGAQFSTDNLQLFELDVQCKGGLFNDNGDITISLNDYDFGEIFDEDVHCFMMYIDPGEYTLSMKEDGKKAVKEKITIPDFSGGVFDPAVIVLYKDGKITWLANDDENYQSVDAETEDFIILPGTSEAVEKIRNGGTVETDDTDSAYEQQSEMEREMLDYYDDSDLDTTEGTEVNAGDTIKIEYVGKMDGDVFEGGSGTSDLTLGSGQMISGFEDGLIGHTVGETVVLNLTFPENYGSDDFNGKDVEFTVKILGVYQL